MTKECSQRVRLIYGTIESVSIAAAAVCLMSACVSIYRQGGHPFSREAVAAAFGPIAIPVYLCLALILGGFLLELILPADQSKPRVKRQTTLILQRLQRRTDLDACDESLRNAVLNQRSRRAKHRKLRNVLLILASAVFLCYGANPAHFHQSEINSSMAKAMLVLLPCLVPCFCYALFVEQDAVRSMEKEIELLKQAVPANGTSGSTDAKPNSGKKTSVIRIVILVLGIALLIYGYCTGGTVDVLTKAINICTECVGLG